MANEEQLAILRQGVEGWNKWREGNPDERVDLRHADFSGVNLNNANFSNADLSDAYLYKASLSKANFSGATLRHIQLMNTDLTLAKFNGADLSGANLYEANLLLADLSGANLRKATLSDTHMENAILTEADLREAYLGGAGLSGADLTGADLRKANLTEVSLVRTVVEKAKISECFVYGINIWDLEGEFAEQTDLQITHDDYFAITVDNIKIAQFIYLILKNDEIRAVINTLTSKTVLILGRFSVPERKAVLDALKNKLREYDLLPIVFDFDRPTDKDFTETIKTLAGISYFVIADVTNPKSSPLELQATVPDYQIPFVPIIQEGESPFAMMVDLQKKYPWVLPTKSYDSIETLMSALKPGIIDPAVEMRNKLRLVKAQEQVTESLRDYVDKTL